jgi:AcrR family transcriptional regulator
MHLVNLPLATSDAVPPFGSGRIAHLLVEARAEFMAHGYQHLSVDRLARASGVSKETIYRYFPDKEAIFRAAVEGLDNPIAGRLRPLDPAADPVEVLAGCARLIHDASVDKRASFLWIAIAVVRDFPDLATTLSVGGLAVMEPIRRYLEALAAAKGRARPIAPELAGQLGALAVDGPRYLMGIPPLPAEARASAARQTARLFLHGCLVGAAGFEPAAWQAEIAPPPHRFAPHLEQLLSEARIQFYARGFCGANLDEIGAAARVGRGTLYRHFSNKAGLFAAAMTHAADELAARAAPHSVRGHLAERLRLLAEDASSVLCSPECVKLYRTVIGESRREPEVARQVYLRTRRPFLAPVTAWLVEAKEQGLLAVGDPDWAARQFLTLATAGNRPLTSDLVFGWEERRRLAERSVGVFMHGYMFQSTPDQDAGATARS